jgi:hypothetical protein
MEADLLLAGEEENEQEPQRIFRNILKACWNGSEDKAVKAGPSSRGNMSLVESSLDHMKTDTPTGRRRSSIETP